MHNYYRTIWLAFAAAAALEAVSYLAFAFPYTAALIFFLAAIAGIAGTITKLEWGIQLALIELIIGSLGTMLVLPLGGFVLTYRMVLWIALLASFGIRALSGSVRACSMPFPRQFVILAAVILWGIGWGFVRGNPVTDVLSDVNNYFYFALIIPAYAAVRSNILRKQIPAIVAAAGTWVALKTLILYYLFSHELFSAQDILYTWSRSSRLAEITNVDPTIILSRIFMQSQIWLVFGLFVVLGLVYALVYKKQTRTSELTVPLIVALVWISAIIASFSRSFWLAIAATLILMVLVLAVLLREQLKRVGSFLALCVGVGVLSVAFTIGIAQFPIPNGTSSADFIKSRAGKFSGESAVSSRYAQIRPLLNAIRIHPVIGSGFGTGVTYASQDPRVLAHHPDGNYTTTAFELGWLEIWLKMGLLGAGAYLYLLYVIFRKGLRVAIGLKQTNPAIAYGTLGALMGLVALTGTHLVSPYLNHPLGIGIVITVAAAVDYLKTKH